MEKRMKFSKFKGKYLGSMNSLKKNGIKIIVMKYFENWLDENIDDIFEKFKESELVKKIKLNTMQQKDSCTANFHSKK